MILDNLGDAGQIERKTYQRRLPENPNKDYYYIIRETTPRESVLVEYGFIDNANDLKKLQNDLDSYAEGVVKAIANYTNTPYTPPNTSSSGVGNIYTVVKGDTLYSIASRFNTTVNELKTLNNLTSNVISIGQQLIVPSVNNNTYIVQKGDSLWAIARKYNVSVEDLINANNLSNLTIYSGQELTIPNSSSNNIVYTVVGGDTLWSISRKYGVSVDEILRKNNLTSTILSIGQQLIIPQ